MDDACEVWLNSNHTLSRTWNCGLSPWPPPSNQTTPPHPPPPMGPLWNLSRKTLFFTYDDCTATGAVNDVWNRHAFGSWDLSPQALMKATCTTSQTLYSLPLRNIAAKFCQCSTTMGFEVTDKTDLHVLPPPPHTQWGGGGYTVVLYTSTWRKKSPHNNIDDFGHTWNAIVWHTARKALRGSLAL